MMLKAAHINRILHVAGLHLSRFHNHQGLQIPPFIDAAFVALYRKHRERTMVPWEGCHNSFLAARYVAQHGIAGDIVECGVWRGGSSALIADTLASTGVTDRTLYLYDTFEGMSEPTQDDRQLLSGQKSAQELLDKADKSQGVWARASLEDVQDSMCHTAYPYNQCQFIKGKVEDTIPGTLPEQIALLRLDTDWYESTLHELEHLFPLLTPGGVFICDDYSQWSGARKALDEYLEKHKIRMFLQPDTAYGAVVGIKQ